MLVSEMNGIRPVDAGRQDCHDLHSWGPGVRQCYIIHYIISGKGTFTCGKKTYTLTAGQSFLICPEQVVQYAPDENEPWEYVWVDFVGEQCRQILEPVLFQLQEYAQHVEKFRILGIVSVEGSPNCGYHLTCEGEWKGEIGTDEKRIQDIQKSLKMTEKPGVYMEVLEEELRKKNMKIPIMTMQEALQLLKN